MGSSAYFEVYTVRNVQTDSRISLREPSISISSICRINVQLYSKKSGKFDQYLCQNVVDVRPKGAQ